MKNWNAKYVEGMSRGDVIADKTAKLVGSWEFIIWGNVFVFLWVGINVYGLSNHWDPYPFILLNLVFS